MSCRRESLGPRTQPHILWVLAVGALRSTLHPPQGGACPFGALQLSPVPASSSEPHLGPEGARAPSCGHLLEQPLAGFPLSGSAVPGAALSGAQRTVGSPSPPALRKDQEGPCHVATRSRALSLSLSLALALSRSQGLSGCRGQPPPGLALETLLSTSARACQPASFWIEPCPQVWRKMGVCEDGTSMSVCLFPL